VQVAEQQSPLAVLPSSHSSPASRTSSPQTPVARASVPAGAAAATRTRAKSRLAMRRHMTGSPGEAEGRRRLVSAPRRLGNKFLSEFWSDGDARMGVGLQERSGRVPRALYALPVTPDFFARTPGRARRRSGIAAPRALLGRALDDLQIECGRGQRARVRLARR